MKRFPSLVIFIRYLNVYFCVSFPQAKRVGNPSENKERFRTSLPASGSAKGYQGRNDKNLGLQQRPQGVTIIMHIIKARG